MVWSANSELAHGEPSQPTRRSSNATPPMAPSSISPASAFPASASVSPPSSTSSSSLLLDASLAKPPSSPPTHAMASAPPTSQRSGASTNKLFAIFFLIVCSCGIGLVSVSSLLQAGDAARGGRSSLSLSTQLKAESPGLRRGGGGDTADGNANGDGTPVSTYSAATTNAPNPTPANQLPVTTGVKLPVEERWRKLGDLAEYECVAWRPCKDCSPLNDVETDKTQPCNATIPNNVAGFCELRHKTTGQTQRVMEMYCDSLRPSVEFKCEDFYQILTYGRRATQYVHDTAFSYDQCRRDFVRDQKQLVTVPQNVQTEPDAFFKRGIVIVVYEKLLESVFASIKSMRQMGCALPVELWYIASETDIKHPILHKLTTEYGAYLREITDPRASRFYTKIYAVFYSAFDQVLLLDADNFAVRDPTYLFASEPFVRTGAIFWPDFWRFKKTIFNIQPTSFVWDVFDLDPVDMFEQESGQVLIDRRRHLRAMNVMMYYAFHPTVIESMRLVWGDKDLFRFAWMKTQSSFHMIQMPPGAAGVKLSDRNVFCGVTMVQHDTDNNVMFLHRNQEKLTSENRRIVWKDLQQFKLDEVSIEEYDVRGANGGRYYPMFKRCYGKDIYYEKAFVVKPVAELAFAGLESRLLDFIYEAAVIANSTAAAKAT